MTIGTHLKQFSNMPITPFEPGKSIAPTELGYRISVDYDAAESGVTMVQRLDQYLQTPRADNTTVLVIGAWEGAGEEATPDALIEHLIMHAEQLPKLQGLFVGDIVMEESEMSWIGQSARYDELLKAYPQLRSLGIRGGNGLRLSQLKSASLQNLTIQTGGLPKAVLADIVKAELPALQHLELWLGEDNYGFDGSIKDITPLWAAGLPKNLNYLGLRNADIADEIAIALANAQCLKQLHTLDLSLGALTDTGGQALLDNPHIQQLSKLDLHYHYLSKAMMTKLKGLPITVNVDQQQQEDDWGDGEMYRPIFVGE